MLNGDTEVLEDRLESLVKAELETYIYMSQDNEMISQMLTFKESIEQTINETEALANDLKTTYETTIDQYKSEFELVKDNFEQIIDANIENYQQQFEDNKNSD